MKRIFNIGILIAALFFSTVSINAASFSIGASQSSVAPGATFQVNINVAGEGRFDIKVSNGTTSASNFWYPDSRSVTIIAGQSGTVTVTVTATNVSTSSADPQPVTGSQSVSVNIVAPSQPNPPTTPGGKPSTPAPKPTPPVKTPEQIAKEEAAAKEAAEAAEKEAKELEQKTPLIKDIDLVSMSDKRYNQSINVTETAHDTWDYEYTLPKRIDKFRLSVNAIDSDVVLTYDEEYEFLESDEDVKNIVIRAVKGDIVQEFTYKVSKDVSTPVVFEMNGENISVFEDDLLDEFMVAAGFTRGTYKGADDADLSFFEIGKVKIQLILNSNNELQWHLLGEHNTIGEPVGLVFDAEKNPFFITQAPTEIADLKFRGNSYTMVDGKVEDTLHNLDASVKWQNKYKAWTFDEAQLVYGMNQSGEMDTFKIVPEQSTDLAVVAFDAAGNNTMKTIAIASSVALVLVSAYAVYVTMILKRKENINK